MNTFTSFFPPGADRPRTVRPQIPNSDREPDSGLRDHEGRGPDDRECQPRDVLPREQEGRRQRLGRTPGSVEPCREAETRHGEHKVVDNSHQVA